jgi:hypothetical protein
MEPNSGLDTESDAELVALLRTEVAQLRDEVGRLRDEVAGRHALGATRVETSNQPTFLSEGARLDALTAPPAPEVPGPITTADVDALNPPQ